MNRLINPHSLAALAPLFLAVVMLLAPLAAGYAWVSGGHAGESHVHRHHLLEKLVPNSYHHPMERPPEWDDTGPEADGYGWSVIMHGVSAAALAPVTAPAYLPELVSYFEGATAALLATAVAALLLTHHVMPFCIHSTRPQTQSNPPERPPTA